MHQGDPQGAECGLFHINAVDEVTQWEVAASVERISETYLKPALEQMIAQFPFEIRGFHTDNGSEFVNRTVTQLLDKLRIEQTKSRPRRSGDNPGSPRTGLRPWGEGPDRDQEWRYYP